MGESVPKILVAITLAFAIAWPLQTSAHLTGSAGGENFNPWQLDPIALLLLVLVGGIYWRGCRRFATKTLISRRAFKRRRYCFWAGWSALAIALASPLDPLGEVLFSAHMVQHEVMMLVAAPLLVASRPTSAILRGLSRPVGRIFGTLTRMSMLGRIWETILSPPVAWFLHLVGLWGWHLPFLFEASLHSVWIHTLQHFSFLLVALVFWFAIMRPHQSASAAGVIVLFTTALHASLLGALLTFSPEVWYTPYIATAPKWGFTALEDQQLGGLIMWMPAGIVFITAGLWLLARTMRDSDATSSSQSRLNREG